MQRRPTNLRYNVAIGFSRMSKQLKPKKQTKTKRPGDAFIQPQNSGRVSSDGFSVSVRDKKTGELLLSREFGPVRGGTKLSALRSIAAIEGERSEAIEYASVLSHAVDTFGSRTNANAWLNRPNRMFANKTPLQILTEDPEAVEEELVRIDHGMFA